MVPECVRAASKSSQFSISNRAEYGIYYCSSGPQKLTDNLVYYAPAEMLMEFVDEVSVERIDGLCHGRITILYSDGVTQGLLIEKYYILLKNNFSVENCEFSTAENIDNMSYTSAGMVESQTGIFLDSAIEILS